jgi:hypothetical protein
MTAQRLAGYSLELVDYFNLHGLKKLAHLGAFIAILAGISGRW